MGDSSCIFAKKTSDVFFTHEADELVLGMSKCLELPGSASETKVSTKFLDGARTPRWEVPQ